MSRNKLPWIHFLVIVMISGFLIVTQAYDDYGEEEVGKSDPSAVDHHDPKARQEMMNDIKNQKNGHSHELSTKTKTFKLFEKRRLNHDKAKAFCKKREGQLAQAMNVDEMQRIQTLLLKGTSLSTSVWVGADKKEWKKHSSKMTGFRPKLPEGAMMMGGGGPTNMCPSMSMSTRSLTPVECYKDFAFICEFPLGKGTPAEKGKRKKRDEMRRKREILRLSPTTDAFDEIYPASTDNTVELQESPASTYTSDQTGIGEYEQLHKIGFRPHIEYEKTTKANDVQLRNGYSSTVNDANVNIENPVSKAYPDTQLFEGQGFEEPAEDIGETDNLQHATSSPAESSTNDQNLQENSSFATESAIETEVNEEIGNSSYSTSESTDEREDGGLENGIAMGPSTVIFSHNEGTGINTMIMGNHTEPVRTQNSSYINPGGIAVQLRLG